MSAREARKSIRVEWIDSEALSSGWTDKDDFDKFAQESITPCVTVGMLWHETDEFVTLVMSESKDCVNGNLKIPKVAIISQTELK